MKDATLLRHLIAQYREQLRLGEEATIASLILGSLRDAQRELAAAEAEQTADLIVCGIASRPGVAH